MLLLILRGGGRLGKEKWARRITLGDGIIFGVGVQKTSRAVECSAQKAGSIAMPIQSHDQITQNKRLHAILFQYVRVVHRITVQKIFKVTARHSNTLTQFSTRKEA